MESKTTAHSPVKSLSNSFDNAMNSINKQSLGINGYRQAKNKQPQNQRITLVLFLLLHTTAVSMSTKATEVDQKSITHCKRCLEELGLIQGIERKHIKLIDFQVFYFTLDKELFNCKYFDYE